jgi:hypothetical protein
MVFVANERADWNKTSIFWFTDVLNIGMRSSQHLLARRTDLAWLKRFNGIRVTLQSLSHLESEQTFANS